MQENRKLPFEWIKELQKWQISANDHLQGVSERVSWEDYNNYDDYNYHLCEAVLPAKSPPQCPIVE